jgi:hypothetical protein
MRPKSGGRIELELQRAAPEVEYRASLSTPDGEWQGTARIDGGGAVSLDGLDGAPTWLVDYARAFLRAEWRGRQGPDPEPWPDRIGRWRANESGGA